MTWDDSFREQFIQRPESRKRQCMMSSIGAPLIQCINEAQFTVADRSGQVKDVCRECLPVVCETHDEHDPLAVMRLLDRSKTSQQIYRF